MQDKAVPGDLLWLRRLSAMLAVSALLGGVVSFCGWALDIPRLTDWVDSGISIQPNTAVLIALAGAAMLLLQFGKRRLAVALGGLVAVAGALNLLQYVTGADFGFNHQLLFGRSWGQKNTVTPGRFGPPASTSFVLIGTSLVILGLRRPRAVSVRHFVPALALIAAVIMMFSLLGYLFGARNFYSIPWLSAIALQTSTLLMALAIGLIVSVPDHQPMLMLCERSSAGLMARTVLPILIVMIPLVIWLRDIGLELNLYDQGTGRTLGSAVLVLGTVALMWTGLLALRRREQSERDADRHKDEFLATLAHELRNPLAPIRNALAVLNASPDDRGAFDYAREVMERQLGHMVRLIDDLLDMGRITHGKLELRRERVQLAPIISQAIETSRPMLDRAGHQLTLALPPQPVFLEADPIRLAQVFCNLLNNACKFTESGGQISLTAEGKGDEVVIFVKDTGVGIAPDKIDAIFEMFSQVDRTLERSHGGLGIGLSLAKRLVELHGGRIGVRSDGVGKGSEFSVRLPVVAQPPTAVAGPSEKMKPKGIRRVLVVDDNRDSADSLAMLLKLTGYETRTAYDGQEAVESGARFHPDVILLDIGMPKLNGYAACRSIRESPWGRSAVIIAMTGWGQDEDKRKSREAGFDAHVVKPVNNTELMRLLGSFAPEGKSQLASPCS